MYIVYIVHAFGVIFNIEMFLAIQSNEIYQFIVDNDLIPIFRAYFSKGIFLHPEISFAMVWHDEKGGNKNAMSISFFY